MNSSKLKRIALILLLASIVAGLPTASARADGAKDAYDYLARQLTDEKNSTMVISAFHAADDKALAPLFVALSRSNDKRKRLLATTALGQLGGTDAIAALKRQVADDSAMSVRAAALVHLLNIKAADPDTLSAAARIKDDNIQCIAARSLAVASKKPSHRDQAKKTLTQLTRSTDTMTSGMASLGLLAMGETSRLEGLKKLISDPKTDPTTVRLMMLQIVGEKILTGQPLAQLVVNSTKQPMRTRILACRALAVSSKQPVPIIFNALRNSPDMTFRIQAMGVLSEQADSKRYLAAIAKSSLPVGALAGFELARKDPGPKSAAAVEKALAIRHPIAVSHVLHRARKDIDKLGAKASFYVAALLKYIASVEPDTEQLAREHLLAAQATTLLLDLGTPAAIQGIDKILSGRYSAITRAAAAGLLRTKNRAVVPIARKLLKNPYPEISTQGALTLGHFSDRAASDYFSRIIKRQAGRQVAEVTLASWYLLKTNNQSAQTAQKLAKLVE